MNMESANLVDLSLSAAMATCRLKSRNEIYELMDVRRDRSDRKVESLLSNCPLVRSLSTDKESAIASNKSLAEWNMAQKPRIDSVKAQTIDLYEQSKRLKDEVIQMKAHLDSISSSKSLDTISSLMQVAAQEADDDAEMLLRQFEDGEISIDIFLKQFKERKTVAHLRKIKADRLAAILREQTYGTLPSRGLQTAPAMPSYPPTNTMPGAQFGSGYSGYPNLSAAPTGKHPFF